MVYNKTEVQTFLLKFIFALLSLTFPCPSNSTGAFLLWYYKKKEKQEGSLYPGKGEGGVGWAIIGWFYSSV